MIGNNEFNLNQATIIEALQEYLDKRYTPKVKVICVKATTVNGYSDNFEIKIEGGKVEQ